MRMSAAALGGASILLFLRFLLLDFFERSHFLFWELVRGAFEGSGCGNSVVAGGLGEGGSEGVGEEGGDERAEDA